MTVAIGAIYNDANEVNSGHVRIFNYDCSGCTDSTAYNYDPLATQDDGSVPIL